MRRDLVFVDSAKDSSVPERTQTATFMSSDAANPRVPVPKFCVVSLSPTFAGRDLTLWRLKSHIFGPPQSGQPLSQLNPTLLFPMAHQSFFLWHINQVQIDTPARLQPEF